MKAVHDGQIECPGSISYEDWRLLALFPPLGLKLIKYLEPEMENVLG